jgi:hypothetical protein
MQETCRNSGNLPASVRGTCRNSGCQVPGAESGYIPVKHTDFWKEFTKIFNKTKYQKYETRMN